MDERGLGTLDCVYAPSSDVAADTRWFTEVLGAAFVFAIDSDGTRVAMIRVHAEPLHRTVILLV